LKKNERWLKNWKPREVKTDNRGIAGLAFTVNAPDELLALAHMGVDGIFTGYYSESASLLAPYIDPRS
jgi:glycerophosphoryl diester phosphodiesterase